MFSLQFCGIHGQDISIKFYEILLYEKRLLKVASFMKQFTRPINLGNFLRLTGPKNAKHMMMQLNVFGRPSDVD